MSNSSATVEQPTVVPEAQKLERYRLRQCAARLCVFEAFKRAGAEPRPIGHHQDAGRTIQRWGEDSPLAPVPLGLPDGQFAASGGRELPPGVPRCWLFQCRPGKELRRADLQWAEHLAQATGTPVRFAFPIEGRVYLVDATEIEPFLGDKEALAIDPWGASAHRWACRELVETLRRDYGMSPNPNPFHHSPDWWPIIAASFKHEAACYQRVLEQCNNDPWLLLYDNC